MEESYLNDAAKYSYPRLCVRRCYGWEKSSKGWTYVVVHLIRDDLNPIEYERIGSVEGVFVWNVVPAGSGHERAHSTKVDECQTHILMFPETFTRVPSGMTTYLFLFFVVSLTKAAKEAARISRDQTLP